MISTTTRRLAAAIFVAGLSPAVAQAGTMPTNEHEFIHASMGATTPEARSVGSITVGYTASNLVARGSGVLVGGRYVLTAAHLVDDANVGQFTINGQNYNMRRWVVANRFYNRGADDDPNPDERIYGAGADLAIVQLDRNVVGAKTLRATISKSRTEAGKTATIVGHGRGGNGAIGINVPNALGIPDASQVATIPTEDGSFGVDDPLTWNYQPVRRAGKNVIEDNGPFNPGFVSNRELVTDFDPNPDILLTLAGLNPPQYNPFTREFDIDEDDVPIAGEYMPAVGDSGGGLFVNGRLAGITSWSTRANSEYFAQAHYTRLSVGWWKWVRDNIAAFNHADRFGLTDRPWNRVDNGGNGFRGVAKILAEADNEDLGISEGDILRIFGPGLFFNETGDRFDVTQGGIGGLFVADDLFAEPAPLPEPTSLALVSLGGLAVLRRTRG